MIATIHTNDVGEAIHALRDHGAKIVAYSAQAKTITIDVSEERFFNLTGLYPNFVGIQNVRGSYAPTLKQVEINKQPGTW